MRLHVVEALTVVAIGWLHPWAYVRDWWRSRTDEAVDAHPMAAALRALAAEEPPHITRERKQASAIAERLRRREVVAEDEFVDVAAWAGERRRAQ